MPTVVPMDATECGGSPAVHLKAQQMEETEQLLEIKSMLSNQNVATSVSPSTPVSRAVTDDSAIFTHQSSIDSQNTTTNSNVAVVIDTQLNHDTATPNTINTANTAMTMTQSTLTARGADQDGNAVEPQSVEVVGPHDGGDEEIIVLQNQLTGHSNGSYYVQDADDDQTVLLNTHTRRQRSTRSSRGSRVSRVSSSNDPLAREDHLIDDVAQPVVDTQTQAQTSPQQNRNSTTIKKFTKRSTTDDERVLVGKKVSEGHQNYVIAYNMLTGIRVSVSRCSGVPKPITNDDFKLIQKLRFDSSGNELTPSSKYDFKFKDYYPTVFRELRKLFGLDPADYLVSLTSKYILSELNSPGKSGSFFYFSRDYRFIIKTIHYAEHRQLRRILKRYYEHVKSNPNTLISQFYGLHRVKMPLKYGARRKIYFIVMNNLFPPHRDIDRTYDLKGSTMGRYTSSSPSMTKQLVLKDLNWLQNQEIIQFGPLKQEALIKQLESDVQLLIKLNIMDYSFLIGFHDRSKISSDDDDPIKRKKLSVFSPVSSNLKDLKNTNPKTLNDLSDLPQVEYYHKSNFFYTEDGGGIVATGPNNENLEYVYYFGIIDCLTNYSIIKKLETFWRSLNHDRRTISAVPPREYGERFLRFVQNSINENHAGEEKKKV